MDTASFNNPKLGSDSQDSDDLQPPGTPGIERPLIKFSTKDAKLGKSMPLTSKGVEQAKKRLRAFSIQKKTSLSPVGVPKPVNAGIATVFIGKASGVKSLPKTAPEPNPDDPKKPPKPPKPGGTESYINTQKKTLAEIEDMKRKMELIELGIPLGLICPAPNSDKAMPTKAMPPIKTFLDDTGKENASPTQAKRTPRYIAIHRDKVDELIREGKKARAEGKEFKFDYRKLLPDYDNPFQRKKDLQMAHELLPDSPKLPEQERKSRDRDKRRSDKSYDSRRYSSHKSDDKYRHRDDKYKDKSKEKNSSKERDKSKDRERRDRDTKQKDRDDKSKERDVKSRESAAKSKEQDKAKDNDETDKERELKTEEVTKESEKEAEVNLKDFVVCDSWSDNDDKSKDSTPKPEEVKVVDKTPVLYTEPNVVIDPMQQLRESLVKKEKEKPASPRPKLKRLNPVDAIKYEVVEPDDDDDILDMFEERSSLDKFGQVKPKKEPEESPLDQLFDFDDVKDETFEGMADDTFLESVINEIKQEEIDETSQDKGLVEYDESPCKDEEETRSSVTPEMDDRTRQIHSSRSDYSDGYKSTESGYKSTDSLKLSDYKSDSELETVVEDRERQLEMMVEERKIDKYTADSLETWSFVLKVCQPLLFRHDRNKCYKETRVAPKLWYTENPKLCNCVKDRTVVYEELDMYKMKTVDGLYTAVQFRETVAPTSRGWYPRGQQWPSAAVQASSEWEAEDSQPEQPPATPEPAGDMSLDKEYQRFMVAVRPEVVEAKSETPRSTPAPAPAPAPVPAPAQAPPRRDASKKKAAEPLPDKRKKRVKMSSEGWSQESEIDEDVDKSYNALQDYLYEALHYTPKTEIVKKVKEKRKRKHSTSTSVTDSSESEPKKRKKMQKKKDNKKSKSKDSKRRRVSKKNIKKLKEKPKKKKKADIDEDSDIQELEKEKKKREKKLKKKKLQKQKKKNQKKKSRAKSSSSSDSSSDSEPEKKTKRKKKSDKKKKRKKSESQEELFDVNILNNIKTERDTEEELSTQMEFSPRRQKPREIINVKELQNDFVGNSIQIKKEVEEDEKRKEIEKRVVESGEKHEEQSEESQIQKIKSKEEEESQSTPQLRPDESNNSQCSSQESVYSLKDQPVYEKDESHLRPSSQNSNYSFHDVMASGKYSKNKQIEQENVHRFEHDSRSQGSDRSRQHDVRSHEHDLRSQEHDLRSQEHDLRSQEHDMRSQEHDMRSQEHDMRSQEHEMRSQELNLRSQEHELRSQEHELRSREHDLRSREHDMRHARDLRSREQELQSYKCDTESYEHNQLSLEHDMNNREHRIPRHIRDIPRPEQDIKSHEISSRDHEIHSRHDIQSYKHDMSSNEHDLQSHDHNVQSHEHDIDSQEYEQGNYEMYEQMAMAYQSDVASQRTSPPDGARSRPIETVVRARTCGEIKCDWRADEQRAPAPAPTTHNRPSRWGLKPGEVNIVLTGGGEQYPLSHAAAPVSQPAVYKIQSIANRTDNSTTGYDEAYMDTYGASDKLQYGDCFSTEAAPERRTIAPVASSLDDRINLALRTTVLGEVAKVTDDTEDKEEPEKGILVTKSLNVENRAAKRVTFADGYKPGQDSDVEEPPAKKKKKSRRVGCAWPCPATHPDHVPLWDALPPPPAPAGSPPPPAAAPAPPARLLRAPRARGMPPLLPTPPHPALYNAVKMESLEDHHKHFDPNTMAAFMPPEPPPGLISFQNM